MKQVFIKVIIDMKLILHMPILPVLHPTFFYVRSLKNKTANF